LTHLSSVPVPTARSWHTFLVSKAFTKDDDSEAPLFVAPRAFLPEGVPNYVTARGRELLAAEERQLEAERERLLATDNSDQRSALLAALAARQAELRGRIESATLVDVAAQPAHEVRFGASVRLRYESGEERTYRIVGVDEAEPESGLVAFIAPLARALSGAEVGSFVTVRTPIGEEELEVLAISYDAPAQ
jgi:transcription elongation factor GreB